MTTNLPRLKPNLLLLSLAVVALLLAIVLGQQTISQHQRLKTSQQWVRHTLELQDAINDLLSTTLEGSNAIRGYAITGNESFLPLYFHMRETLMDNYNELLIKIQNNPVQQRNMGVLKPLLQQRLQENDLQHSLVQQQGKKVAQQRIALGIGDKLNTEIKQIINEMYLEESRMLIEREAELSTVSAQSLYTNLGTLALLLLLIGGFVLAVRRELMFTQRHQHERDALNIELDARNLNLSAANEALQEADRLKTEFLSAMSHELRTPLNSIIGFTGLLRMGIPGTLNDEQNKQLQMVDESAKHLLSLINDLLDLSRIEAGRTVLSKEDFEISTVVGETLSQIAPLAKNKNLTLRVDSHSENVHVYTDHRKVYQILLNLVNNAIKFSEQGEIVVRYGISNDHCEISVSDQGIGLREDQIAMLFQAFRQTNGGVRKHYEGAGLGLYLSKKLVELMGGQIRVASELGKGSCFTFTLPLKKDAQ